jgi:TonB family protein
LTLGLQGAAAAQEAPAETRALTPPRLLDANAPVIPEGVEDVEPVVLVHLVVEADGHVGDAHAEVPHDPILDAAAIEAVRTWTFEPAREGDRPIRAAVRVSVRFQSPIPHFDLAGSHTGFGEGVESLNHEHIAEDSHALEEDPEEPLAADAPTFTAEARVDRDTVADRNRAASSYELDRNLLDAAPHADAASMLNSAPGLFVTRPEGDAVAPRIMLRGFDAEHGQDLAINVAGIPINQPSHLHGQGYADMGFVIPDVVRRIRVTEGVYDPRQGDFATAGSVDLDLGVETRGTRLRAGYGSFNGVRALALWAPVGERTETFAAVQFARTDGFGQGREGLSASGLGQAVWGDSRLRTRVFLAMSAARSGIGGALRREDVYAGRIGFYDVYPVTAAQNQSAFSARALGGAELTSTGADGSQLQLGLFAGWTTFRHQANYTGYTQISMTDPTWRGRGDIIEQTNDVFHAGLNGHFRTSEFRPWDWLNGTFEVGIQSRVDVTEQNQNLIQLPVNRTWDQRVDASLEGVDIGAYADLDLHLGEHVRLRGGARADVLFYSVDDRLGNRIPSFRPETYIMGYRRSASGVAAGPRVTLEWAPVHELTLSAAYGEGYRSPQARQLTDGESAPYAKVWSGDVGARMRFGDADQLQVAVSGFLTSVSRDVAFDPDEGRLEPLGPSTRMGAAAQVRFEPWRFLTTALSATYVRATLDAPPVPTLEQPTSAYVAGQLLPYVAPFVLRADVGAHEDLFEIDGHPVNARLGVGLSVLSSRPLPYGDYANPIGLLDAAVSASYRGITLGIEAFNLTNSQYAAAEYSYASDWQDERFQNQPNGVPSRLPTRHFSAGAPLTLMVQLGVEFQ